MIFDQILQTVSEKATYLSKPRVAREGVSTCILRHMSDKELKAYQKMAEQKNSEAKKDENDLKSNELHQWPSVTLQRGVKNTNLKKILQT